MVLSHGIDRSAAFAAGQMGLRRPIYTQNATADSCEICSRMRLFCRERMPSTKQVAQTQETVVDPLYTVKDAAAALQNIVRLSYREKRESYRASSCTLSGCRHPRPAASRIETA